MNIFVFGSNRAGRHGMGAAKDALRLHGAIYGKGEGIQGRSYAIPTKGHRLERLNLTQIQAHVLTFIEFARANPDLTFQVTRVGCGLAGYGDGDISPFFRDAPANCQLPPGWRIEN